MSDHRSSESELLKACTFSTLACLPTPLIAFSVTPYLKVFPSAFSSYVEHSAGISPASAADADAAEDAISTSETPLVPTLNITAAAGDPDSAAGSNPDVAAPAQVLGVICVLLALWLAPAV